MTGTWRARKQGRRLAVTIAPWQPIDAIHRDALDDEAARLAAARGQSSATVAVEG